MKKSHNLKRLSKFKKIRTCIRFSYFCFKNSFILFLVLIKSKEYMNYSIRLIIVIPNSKIIY